MTYECPHVGYGPQCPCNTPPMLAVSVSPALPNGFVDGEARMTVAASTDEGHGALLATLRPAADWVSHRSYALDDGTYRVTFTYRPA